MKGSGCCMSMQACEGDLTLQVILYGVQGNLHLGWWESVWFTYCICLCGWTYSHHFLGWLTSQQLFQLVPCPSVRLCCWIIYSPLLPVPWREARGQDQDWMDHQFILRRAGLGSQTSPCPYTVPYTLLCWGTQGLDAAGHPSLQIKALMALCGAARRPSTVVGDCAMEDGEISIAWFLFPSPCLGRFLFCQKSNLSRLITIFVPIFQHALKT